jgi:hypothetical protein
MAGLFERIHEQLGNGSWLIGRVTGSEYAKADAYPDHPGEVFPPGAAACAAASLTAAGGALPEGRSGRRDGSVRSNKGMLALIRAQPVRLP